MGGFLFDEELSNVLDKGFVLAEYLWLKRHLLLNDCTSMCLRLVHVGLDLQHFVGERRLRDRL